MSHFHFNISKFWAELWWWKRSWSHGQPVRGEPPLRCLDAERQLPRFVTDCPLTMQTISWLRLLKWERLPTHNRQWFGQEPIAIATYIAAFLVKID